MSRIVTEVWTRLESARPVGENLTARLALPEQTDRLLCAIDAEMQRHLLIPLNSSDQTLYDAQSRGLSVETKELTVHGYDTARYLDVTCHDVAGRDALDLIGTEIADAFSRETSSPADIVRRVLAKWRRFWGQLPRKMLSREEQLGLFAELWFLSMWLVPKTGAGEATRRWRGPFGARHDFEWLGRSVEVKATSSSRGPIHRIHGIDQLAPPDHGDLLFFSLRLREEAGASNTLPGVVSLCRQLIATDEEALAQFDIGLAQVGYILAHEEDYEKLRLRVVEEGLFIVDGRFPRVTPDCFKIGVPAGVGRIEYEINLSGFTDLRIATSVEELSSI